MYKVYFPAAYCLVMIVSDLIIIILSHFVCSSTVQISEVITNESLSRKLSGAESFLRRWQILS